MLALFLLFCLGADTGWSALRHAIPPTANNSSRLGLSNGTAANEWFTRVSSVVYFATASLPAAISSSTSPSLFVGLPSTFHITGATGSSSYWIPLDSSLPVVTDTRCTSGDQASNHTADIGQPRINTALLPSRCWPSPHSPTEPTPLATHAAAVTRPNPTASSISALSSSPRQETRVERDLRQRRQLAEEIDRLGLQNHDTGADGDCLFRALADQRYGRRGLHYQVRREVLAFMRANPALFLDFFRSDEWRDLPSPQREAVGNLVVNDDFLGYCDYMEDAWREDGDGGGRWGGGIELAAAATMWGYNIHVIEPESSVPFYPLNAGPQNAEARRPTLFLARLAFHFTSVQFPGLAISREEHPEWFYARPHGRDIGSGAEAERARLAASGATQLWEDDKLARAQRVEKTRATRQRHAAVAAARRERPSAGDGVSQATESSAPGLRELQGMPHAPHLHLDVGFSDLTVIRADGRKCKLEDVRVGDMLMGPDNKPRRVLAVSSSASETCVVEILAGNVDNRKLVLTPNTHLPFWFSPVQGAGRPTSLTHTLSGSQTGDILADAFAKFADLLGGDLITDLPGDNDRTSCHITYPSNGEDFLTVLRRALGYHFSIDRTPHMKTQFRNRLAGVPGIGMRKGAYVVTFKTKQLGKTIDHRKWFVYDRAAIFGRPELPTVWRIGDPQQAYADAVEYAVSLRSSDVSLYNIRERVRAATPNASGRCQVMVDQNIMGLYLTWSGQGHPKIKSTYNRYDDTGDVDDAGKPIKQCINVCRIFAFEGEAGLVASDDVDINKSAFMQDHTALLPHDRPKQSVSLSPLEWAALDPLQRDRHTLEVKTGLDFPRRPLGVHPYLVGLAAGDGTRSGASFSNNHEAAVTQALVEVAWLHGQFVRYDGRGNYRVTKTRPDGVNPAKPFPQQSYDDGRGEHRSSTRLYGRRTLLRQRVVEQGFTPVSGAAPGLAMWERDGEVRHATLAQDIAAAPVLVIDHAVHTRGASSYSPSIEADAPDSPRVKVEALSMDDFLVAETLPSGARPHGPSVVHLHPFQVTMTKDDVDAQAARFSLQGSAENAIGSVMHEMRAIGAYPPAGQNWHGDDNDQKHVPDAIMFNDRPIALEYLAGILDSDGCYDAVGHTYLFAQSTQSHARLFNDVVDLVRRLGFRASVGTKTADAPQTHRDGSSFAPVRRLRIAGNRINEIPCRNERKQARERINLETMLWHIAVVFNDRRVQGQAPTRRAERKHIASDEGKIEEPEDGDNELVRASESSVPKIKSVPEAKSVPGTKSVLGTKSGSSPVEPDSPPTEATDGSNVKPSTAGPKNSRLVHHVHLDGDNRFLRFDQLELQGFDLPSLEHATKELTDALVSVNNMNDWARIQDLQGQVSALQAADLVRNMPQSHFDTTQRWRREDEVVAAYFRSDITIQELERALIQDDARVTAGSRRELEQLENELDLLGERLEASVAAYEASGERMLVDEPEDEPVLNAESATGGADKTGIGGSATSGSSEIQAILRCIYEKLARFQYLADRWFALAE